MDASDVKTAQLPLDFSLNVKSEAIANLNIHVKSNGNSAPAANMLISPDKNSQSAFKVVTPKQSTDGMCYFPFDNMDSLFFHIRKRFPLVLVYVFCVFLCFTDIFFNICAPDCSTMPFSSVEQIRNDIKLASQKVKKSKRSPVVFCRERRAHMCLS